MDFFFVALIIGAVVIGSMIVLHRYRGFEGYRRRLPVSGKGLRDSPADSGGVESSIYLAPIVTSGGDAGGHHSHGADCGSGSMHGGDGGGCSDGGGGGGGSH